MPVKVTLDAALARRGMTGKQLAEKMGLSETQLSLFRSGKVRGVFRVEGTEHVQRLLLLEQVRGALRRELAGFFQSSRFLVDFLSD